MEKKILKTTDRVIKLGIKQLSQLQKTDGSFSSTVSPNPDDFEKGVSYSSIFVTALACLSLNCLKQDNLAEKILEKANDFLLSQKSQNWSYNYLVRKSKWSKKIPIPDDLDDTACALAALYQYDCNIFSGQVLAHFTKVLTLLEKEVGGPYKTWLVPENSNKVWQDTDLAVNINVAYFLSLLDISLPRLNELFDEAIEKKKFSSSYYPSFHSVVYLLSRFYQGEKQKALIDFILSQSSQDNWGNQLNTALMVSALINLNYPSNKLRKSLKYLLVEQESRWRIQPFYFGINPRQTKDKEDKTRHYAGSKALTIALCLEAIHNWKERSNGQGDSQNDQLKRLEDQNRYNKVIQAVKLSIKDHGQDFQQNFNQQLDRILAFDRDKQIVLLPYYFQSALSQPVDDRLVSQLSLANLYGWIAHTIYDDFLDDEGMPQNLPVANFCQREMARIFETILPHPEFKSFFHRVLIRIDTANSFELSHYRFSPAIKIKDINLPSFSNPIYLADRSIGHAISPIAILFALGFSPSSEEIHSTLSFFTHYLTARQMGDDAHDWEDDLARGQINSAGALVLKSAQKNDLLSNKSAGEAMSDLKKTFWNEIAPQFCSNGINQIELANHALRNIRLVRDRAVFLALLRNIEQVF